MPTAYSYLRFSSPEQASGDTLRRQSEKREEWLKANPNVNLDNSLCLTDAGKSGWNRDNFDTYALAEFIKLIGGPIKSGSYLLVENLDRLSREKITVAVRLFLEILEKGVTIVQLLPSVTVFSEDEISREPFRLMQAILELQRGKAESDLKSERIAGAWENKRKNLKNQIASRRSPGWIRAVGGEGKKMKDTAPGEVRFELIEDRAVIVRRIFTECIEGSGVQSIARKLNENKIPTMGRVTIKERGWLGKEVHGENYRIHQVTWNETTVYQILTSRATFGEYQPGRGRKRKNRVKVGEVRSNYYPSAITRETFFAAQAALASRGGKGRSGKGAGRRGNHVNLFAGLLIDALDGGSLTYKHSDTRSPILVPVNAKKGKQTAWTSYPAAPLERALRSVLVEVRTEEIGEDVSPSLRIDALRGRKNELEKLIAYWQGKMGNLAIADSVETKLAEFSTELRAVSAEMESVEREAANPATEAWAAVRTLAGTNPTDDTDELRTRLRAAIRRTVSAVYCFFNGVGRYRLALVQVYFRSGGSRGCFIIYSPGRSNHRVKRPGRVWFSSNRDGIGYDGESAPNYDLRDGVDKVFVPEWLAEYPREKIEEFLAMGIDVND